MASQSRAPRKRAGSPNHWRSRDVLRVAGIVAGVYLALQLLWISRSVVLLTFLAVLFGLCIAAGADYLARWQIPRTFAAVLIVLAALGSLIGIGAVAAPQIAGQMRQLRTELPAAIDRIEQWIGARYDRVAQMIEPKPPGDTAAVDTAGADTANAAASDTTVVKRNLARQVGKFGENFFAVFSSTLAALGGFILVVVVALYVAVDPTLYHRGLMHLFPHRMRPR
jgi:predicted PurR-regulated permease PerM